MHKAARSASPFIIPCLSLGLAACGDDDGPTVDAGTPDMGVPDMGTGLSDLVTTAEQEGLSALVSAAGTAELDGTLATGGPFTVFAPTDSAFAALGDATPTDPGLLANVLLHHVVSGELGSAEVLASVDGIETLAGTRLPVDASASPATVGGAPLSGMLDVKADNGLIHVIDAVMLPPTIAEAVAANEQLSTLETAAGAASEAVRNTLAGPDPITVFAPVNAAFDGIDLDALTQEQIDGILDYHVTAGQTLAGDLADGQTLTMANGEPVTVNVSGDSVTLTDISGATVQVIATDIRLLNGTVHLIDGVLSSEPAMDATIADVAEEAGLTSLLQAASAAGLADALAADGDLTVFAPTNAAFTALGNGAPTDPGLLANVLLNHIVGSRNDSSAVLAAESFTTLANTRIGVDDQASPPTIGGAPLSLGNLDNQASNGIVHLIDQVIVPPTILDAASSLPDLSTLAAAVEGADASVAQTLGGTNPVTVFAPIDSAFEGVDVGALLAEPARLTEILRYHVAAGQTLSGQLTDGQELTMANGGTLTVRIDGEGNVSLIDELGRSIDVVQADVRLLNGTVHLVDGVLRPGNLIEVAEQNGLNTLLDAARRVGLSETLRVQDPLTVFAPTDAAFSNIGANLGNIADPVLQNILLHHVVAGGLDSTMVLGSAQLTNLAGLSLAIQSGPPTTVGGAALSSTLDVEATNGIVHVMDEVIVPPTSVELAEATPTLSTLVRALGNASSTTQDAASPNTIEGEDPITVFAPIDSAFANQGIDPDMLPQSQLDGVLAFHVIEGQILSADLPVGPIQVTTAAGLPLTITKNANGTITLDDGTGVATVVPSLRDLRTLTGAVHGIDRVLIPPTP